MYLQLSYVFGEQSNRFRLCRKERPRRKNRKTFWLLFNWKISLHVLNQILLPGCRIKGPTVLKIKKEKYVREFSKISRVLEIDDAISGWNHKHKSSFQTFFWTSCSPRVFPLSLSFLLKPSTFQQKTKTHWSEPDFVQVQLTAKTAPSPKKKIWSRYGFSPLPFHSIYFLFKTFFLRPFVEGLSLYGLLFAVRWRHRHFSPLFYCSFIEK